MKVSERADRAASVTLSVDDWAEFVADPSPRVRRVLAARADAPRWALERLAGDRDRQTRHAVVGNRACPPDVLLTCLGDGDWQIRWDAVQHPNADLAVRRAAIRSPDKDARWAVAQLPELEPELIDVLLEDSEWQVREQLAMSTQNEAVLEALMSDADARVRGQIALNELVTDDQLRRLADDASAVTRAKVAGRVALPEDVRLRLAGDRSANVRWWLCVVHDGDEALMRTLSADPDEQVATHAKLAVARDRDRPGAQGRSPWRAR